MEFTHIVQPALRWSWGEEHAPPIHHISIPFCCSIDLILMVYPSQLLKTAIERKTQGQAMEIHGVQGRASSLR